MSNNSIINDRAYEFFTPSTGGSNRQWTRRYALMVAKYEILNEMANNKTDKQVLKGFKMCLDIFHQPNIRNLTGTRV